MNISTIALLSNVAGASMILIPAGVAASGTNRCRHWGDAEAMLLTMQTQACKRLSAAAYINYH